MDVELDNIVDLITTPVTKMESVCEYGLFDDVPAIPDYPLCAPIMLPLANTHTILLGFEDMSRTPICLIPPSRGAYKRLRCDDTATTVETATTLTPSPKRGRENKEWHAWINWENAA